MSLTLTFSDSFDHYDDAGIPLKWSSSGGAIETDPAHVRTGPQSLRIQSGASPTITNLNFPGNAAASSVFFFARFVVGFAWQTSSLAGETIFSLFCSRDIGGNPLTPIQRQFFLIQNANGSISVWTGNNPTPTLIATTAAGVLTAGPFWYIEFTVDMIAGTLLLTVTDAANTAVTVLNLFGVVTSQTRVDSFTWGGPSGLNSAWVDDFYFAEWDGTGDGLIGAPKAYGESVPNADGDDRIGIQPGVTPPAFNDTSAPFWSQVNSIPQDVSSFISRGLVAGLFYPNPVGQGFLFDVSSVPVDSTVAAVQVVMLMSECGDSAGDVPIPAAGMIDPDTHLLNGKKTQAQIVDGPFLFYPFPFMVNPNTGDPWTVQEFVDGEQIGPIFIQPG